MSYLAENHQLPPDYDSYSDAYHLPPHHHTKHGNVDLIDEFAPKANGTTTPQPAVVVENVNGNSMQTINVSGTPSAAANLGPNMVLVNASNPQQAGIPTNASTAPTPLQVQQIIQQAQQQQAQQQAAQLQQQQVQQVLTYNRAEEKSVVYWPLVHICLPRVTPPD